jgi:hypothetical protein
MSNITIPRALEGVERKNVGLTGVIGSSIGEDCLDVNKFRRRCRSVGLGTGARNAMEKSVMLLGEEGVTMMAGNGLFSSTKGRVRSSQTI